MRMNDMIQMNDLTLWETIFHDKLSIINGLKLRFIFDILAIHILLDILLSVLRTYSIYLAAE